VGQTERAIETRQKENLRHLYLTAFINLLLCFIVPVQKNNVLNLLSEYRHNILEQHLAVAVF